MIFCILNLFLLIANLFFVVIEFDWVDIDGAAISLIATWAEESVNREVNSLWVCKAMGPVIIAISLELKHGLVTIIITFKAENCPLKLQMAH